MWRRTAQFVLLAILGMSAPLSAQRPLVGFGFGGGVILGTSLLDYGVTIPIDGQDLVVNQEINLDHIGIFDAHVELYPIPHVALRGHGMWGSGDLQIQRSGEIESQVAAGSGRVRISGLDAGISFWPWTPHSVGFAPFVTVGVGRVSYDFNAADLNGSFQALGSRKENAFLFGVGADMSVWRAVTLRIEAMNHRLPSPLNSGDFAAGLVPQSAFDHRISNVSLVLDLHIYLPFSGNSGSSN
jgi:hypothetical protein